MGTLNFSVPIENDLPKKMPVTGALGHFQACTIANQVADDDAATKCLEDSLCRAAALTDKLLTWSVPSDGICIPATINAGDPCSANFISESYSIGVDEQSSDACVDTTSCFFPDYESSDGTKTGRCVADTPIEIGSVCTIGEFCNEGARCVKATYDSKVVTWEDIEDADPAPDGIYYCLAEDEEALVCHVQMAGPGSMEDIPTADNKVCSKDTPTCTIDESAAETAGGAALCDGVCTASIDPPGTIVIKNYGSCGGDGDGECETSSVCALATYDEATKTVTWDRTKEGVCLPPSSGTDCKVTMNDAKDGIATPQELDANICPSLPDCILTEGEGDVLDGTGTCSGVPIEDSTVSPDNASIAMAATLVIALTGFLF